MKKKISALCEPNLVECEILGEEIIDERTKDSVLKVKVKFQHAGILNKNNRRYRSELLAREIERIQPDLKAGKVFGAAYHPKSGEAEVPDVAMIWRSAKIEKDGSCVGKVDILPTHYGKDAQTIIKAGGSIGISSRGYGTTTRKTEGGKTFSDVNDDFFLKTPGDIVLSPSVEDAGLTEQIESHFNKNVDSKVLSESEEMKLEDLTLKALKKDAPEVYAEIEAGIKKKEAEKNKPEKSEEEIATARKKEIETAVDEKLKPLQTEIDGLKETQKKSVEAVTDFASSYFEINGIAEEDEEDEEDDKGKKKDKSNSGLEKKFSELEAKNAELEKKIKDKEDTDKDVADKAAEQTKVKTALEKAIVKEPYKSLIEKELVSEDGTVNIEKEKDVEEAVTAAKTKISGMLVEAKKSQIITGDIDELGKIENPEGDVEQKKKALNIQRRYNEAVDSGYPGSLEDYKKLLVEKEDE